MDIKIDEDRVELFNDIMIEIVERSISEQDIISNIFLDDRLNDLEKIIMPFLIGKSINKK